MTIFGMIGTGNFSAEERPENWRQKVLELYPDQLPLIGITSKMASEATDDPIFHWFEKSMSEQAGTVTDIFTNAGLSTAYTGDAAVGAVLYVVVPLAFIKECPVNKALYITHPTAVLNGIAVKVMDRLENGASSVLTVKCLQADPNDYLATATVAIISGSVFEEGAEIPKSVSYDPTPQSNLTQIHRNSISMTRTAQKTGLRTEEKYKTAKREALLYHGVEMERGLFFGSKYNGTGVEGYPERMSGGILEAAKTRGGLIDNFTTSTKITMATGDTWLEAGEDWLDEVFRLTFLKGSRSRAAFVGSKVVAAVNKLIKSKPNITYSMSSSTRDYGLNITTLSGPFGKMEMINHPLFDMSAALMDLWVSFDPSNLRWRYIDDTNYYKDANQLTRSRYARRDRLDEEYLTEGGFEIHHASTIMVLTGFGGVHV